MENHPFVPGKDKVFYSRAIYGQREIAAVMECLDRDWLGIGEYSKQFEDKVAAVFGQKIGVFVNSGSSANLLGIRSLGLPVGGEVITPACTFSTTLNPILEAGLVPVFIDVDLNTYNVNLDNLREAISPATVAMMIPHLIGNLNDMRILHSLAETYSLKLVEDSCDTIGGTIGGEPTGRYADVSTTSFYASHIITAMGGGGMVMFKNKDQATRAHVLRDWGRASTAYYDEHPDIRFNLYLGDTRYDNKFVFRERGYNFKAQDPHAAFGLVQLSRLDEFNVTRKKNFAALYDFFKEFTEHFILPEQATADADVRWLAFPLTIQKNSPLERIDLMLHLEEHHIQTRVLFAGNILRHPPYKGINHRVVNNLGNSDSIMARSLLIGCHHGLRNEHLDYVKQVVADYLRKF